MPNSAPAGSVQMLSQLESIRFETLCFGTVQVSHRSRLIDFMSGVARKSGPAGSCNVKMPGYATVEISR
jgi:hypothetical protein